VEAQPANTLGQLLVGKKLKVAASPKVAISPCGARAPKAWAASSTTFSPCAPARSMNDAMSAAWPKMCTGSRALVREVIFRSVAAGSRQ
jgi:hypothetical protein